MVLSSCMNAAGHYFMQCYTIHSACISNYFDQYSEHIFFTEKKTILSKTLRKEDWWTAVNTSTGYSH